MYLTKIDPKDFTLAGITADFVIEGTQIKAISLRSGDKHLVIKHGEAYSNNLCIFLAEKFQKAERYVLEGNFLGLPVREVFETASGASERKNELCSASSDGDGLTITKKTVEFGADAHCAPDAPDMPF